MKPQNLSVLSVYPSMGVPGGEVAIRCRGFHRDHPYDSRVLFGEAEAEIVSASEDLIIARLPDSPRSLGVSLSVGSSTSPAYPFNLAVRLATGLHPVSNPVVVPDESIITTISGPRGQAVSQPVVRIMRSGEKRPLSCEIMNPTGLALGRDDQLYVSSRNDGTVLRITESEETEVVAEDLGVACGIVFDSKGFLYVGDRTGKIFRLGPSGEKEEFALLEASVSAYHLAIDHKDRLYVTGPTFSMRDNLYRISAQGKAEVLLQGLARPQGMAFLPSGELLIATAFQGKKGIFKFDPDTRNMVHYISGPVLVGVAVSGAGIFLVDGSALFWLQPGGARSS